MKTDAIRTIGDEDQVSIIMGYLMKPWFLSTDHLR